MFLEILLAKKSGFCFGVKAAIDTTFKSIESSDNSQIYTYGPLIHNNQVIKELKKLGIESIDKLEDAKDSTLIIRSHGVPYEAYDEAKKLNINLVDCTCPFVRKVQRKAKEYYEMNYKIVIIGNPEHPEVVGINGWCSNEAIVIKDKCQVELLPCYDKICVVAQTTLTMDKWNIITEKLEKKTSNLKKFNTICLATKERQEACDEISRIADLMIVIGGHHSSNTQKLYNISKENCRNTIHIESANDLSLDSIEQYSKIGITAGASTPEWVIEEIITKLESKGGRLSNDYGKKSNGRNATRK